MDEEKVLSTIEEIRAVSDPYRVRILGCFRSLGEPATVKQVADRIGEVPANVHYHVKKMERLGILRLTHTKEVNGIIAKYYEPTARKFTIKGSGEDSPVSDAMLSEAQKLIASGYDESKRIFLESMENKNLSEREGQICVKSLHLTPGEYKELENDLAGLLDKYSCRKEAAEGTAQYHIFISMIPTK
jgi:DNA-binding transcriptional ArsR family regulator